MLIEVASMFNGANNGDLFVSVRDAARLIGLRDVGAASAALRALVEHGFLRVAARGSFTVKTRHATAYRLTWQASGEQPPTNEWRDWKPTPDTDAWKRIERLRGSNLRCGKTALSVLETCTAQARQGGGAVQSVKDSDTGAVHFQRLKQSVPDQNSGTQVIYQGVEVKRATPEACRVTRSRARLHVARTYGGRQQLARAAAISPSKLSRFLNDEAGRRTLTVDQLDRLNRALGEVGRHA